ncbi:type II toxin-antitoxin system ParD family antitoxin [Agrobacterium sp. a22-2]|uniref:ribbon-helix-helix domain-containing protein n=1 Tax=Agrobacterium sp. a22-2 TaxID=2283840 RepID=UPI001446B419|nr:type II toxin-antitoxin system ParD family antitoxin [Agrobacterium sp. a22-2]NKN36495.1 type II toxin-antitoxin system ParD family antitoxin [Agrobacterium sp. a22-2]
MTKHIITLPEPIAEFLKQRIADGQYESASQYILDLVTKDMSERSQAAETLRALLQDAEDSGISDHSLEEIFDLARSEKRRSAGTA